LRRFDDAVDWRQFPGELLLKVDVEGSEAAVLRGAACALTARRPRVLVEVNPWAMAADAESDTPGLLETLLSLGYTTAQPVGCAEQYDLQTIDWGVQGDVLVSSPRQPVRAETSRIQGDRLSGGATLEQV
jgi:hypothetical protein